MATAPIAGARGFGLTLATELNAERMAVAFGAVADSACVRIVPFDRNQGSEESWWEN
jgi:hypothetical protein